MRPRSRPWRAALAENNGLAASVLVSSGLSGDGYDYINQDEYGHSLGLKFGLYVTPGISDQAVSKNTPIQGTSYTASRKWSWSYH